MKETLNTNVTYVNFEAKSSVNQVQNKNRTVSVTLAVAFYYYYHIFKLQFSPVSFQY